MFVVFEYTEVVAVGAVKRGLSDKLEWELDAGIPKFELVQLSQYDVSFDLGSFKKSSLQSIGSFFTLRKPDSGSMLGSKTSPLPWFFSSREIACFTEFG